MLFSVYQDWVHQNTEDKLDGRIIEDGKWEAWQKIIVCIPTQRYGAPYRKVRKRFVGILSMEINGVSARKCNLERVIVFQAVIL